MKKEEKLSLLPWLKKTKLSKKDCSAPLYMRITIDSRREEISLNRKVDPAFWNAEMKLDVKPGSESKITNQKLAQLQVDLQRHFTILSAQYESVTPTMLKNVYFGIDPLDRSKTKGGSDNKQITILQAMDRFIETFSKKAEVGIRSVGTKKHWVASRKKVHQFIKFKYGCADLDITDVKYHFAPHYFDYLTLEVDNPLSEVTAKGHLKKLNQILKECVNMDYLQKNPFAGYTCKVVEPEVQPLEFYEVETIYYKNFGSKRLEEIRDGFIVQCFTGFSYMDVEVLSKDHIIKVGIDGEEWFTNPRGKTDVQESVPILPIVSEIIEKYKNHPECTKKNRLFPIKSNTKYNAYLKEIGDICGINKELKTHLARHTFADMMLSNDFPLEDVQKMLGHKSIRTTQRYARVRKERISRNMNKVKTKLFTKLGKLKRVA